MDIHKNCPECGAAQDDLNCWEQLGGILAWEYQDAELAAEHFLTVACYNLQHPAQFTDEALDWLRQGFIARMDEGLANYELRKQASNLFDGKKRVLVPKAERRPVLKSWRMTIANVYLPERPAGAAARVRQWAKVIREEM